ncbi:MAG: adenylyl-sulfate kinase [Candidatus Hodarchaeota archaeon]
MNRKIDSKGFTLWFTGLSGAGKSTIADALVSKLREKGLKVERLDGDIVRKSLTKDLGFSMEDRKTNIERVTFVAKLLTRNDVAVLLSFISPSIKVRNQSREEIGNFIEVFVKCSLQGCIDRDVKGMYKKAIAGEIKDFTGIHDTAPYEEPPNPEIVLDTEKYTVEECVQQVMDYLSKNSWID